MKVLLAEDDPVTRESLSACLVGEGFDVAAAENGKVALEQWSVSRPDVLCLDIMMPEVDGYEVCRRVRAEDSAVPILFLSAKSEEIDVVVGLELGADDFLRKPFGTHEFMARVRAALRRSKGDQPSEKQCFEMGDLRVFPRRGTRRDDPKTRPFRAACASFVASLSFVSKSFSFSFPFPFPFSVPFSVVAFSSSSSSLSSSIWGT